jgi:hypothetical protein
MKGLIIKKEWLEQIFEAKYPFKEQKTWEIRRNNTKIRGKIYLIESGSSTIVGECEIIDSIELNEQIWNKNYQKHQVCLIQNKKIIPYPYKIINQKYPKPHAWVMTNIKKYNKPIPYKHPQGAVIWVNNL